jgi:hypothetical protein
MNAMPFTLEIKEALKKIARTDLEVQILQEGNWGLSNTEIGRKLGKTPQWILRVRRRLRERYERLV